MTNKKKSTEPKERAIISRERRLALALRALLDSLDGKDGEIAVDGKGREHVIMAEKVAEALLADLGYKGLESIPRRVTCLNESLKQALESGDGKLISELGLALERAKAGLPPAKVVERVSSKPQQSRLNPLPPDEGK